MIYVPILRGKLGEFKGLTNLSIYSKSRISPMIRIADPDLDYDIDPPELKCSHKDHFAKIAKYARKFLNGEISVFVDFEIDPGVRIEGRHYSEFLYSELNRLEVDFVPVISFDRRDELGYIDAIKSEGLQRQSDICIRLTRDYIETVSMHAEDLRELVEAVKASGKTYINLDFERIEEVGGPAKAVDAAISVIKKNNIPYNYLIVSSACMPENISDFETNAVSTQRRFCWELWQSLIKKHDVIFSDYGILNPSIQNINPKTMTRSSRIRYSTEEGIVIFKGESHKKTAGRIQNPKLARQLMTHPEYKGVDYCWGDSFIKDCSSGKVGPGNPTTWISVELNHHITLVSEQLANHFGF